MSDPIAFACVYKSADGDLSVTLYKTIEIAIKHFVNNIILQQVAVINGEVPFTEVDRQLILKYIVSKNYGEALGAWRQSMGSRVFPDVVYFLPVEDIVDDEEE